VAAARVEDAGAVAHRQVSLNAASTALRMNSERLRTLLSIITRS